MVIAPGSVRPPNTEESQPGPTPEVSSSQLLVSTNVGTKEGQGGEHSKKLVLTCCLLICENKTIFPGKIQSSIICEFPGATQDNQAGSPVTDEAGQEQEDAFLEWNGICSSGSSGVASAPAPVAPHM